ncbi:MAG: exported protein of unknown function [Candidatus Saccharibacteria bacterium]|nr:exported protein of unknown function [Candidatus Saccharibacteria bacterium]
MDRSGIQRIIPIVLVLIVIVVAAVALFSVARTLFFSGDSNTSQTQTVNSGKQALTNIQAGHSVRMTYRGPIVGQDKFHTYTITASPDSRNMTTYVGYLGQQVDTSQLTNNTQAYEQLVFALDRAKLMDGTPLTGDADDRRGICATGTVYEFDVLEGSSSIQNLWTSTCKASAGSLKASLPAVSKLFQLQIPDYSKLFSKMNSSS